MSKMFSNVGAVSFDKFLANPVGAVIVGLPLKPGQGVLEIGTVIYKPTTAVQGFWLAATTSELTSSYNLAILGETVDTDAEPAASEDARCLISGQVIRSAVKLASGSALTAGAELAMKHCGILLTADADGTIFDNGMVIVTYKANGGTGADVIDGTTVAGSSVTVKAGSIFTAPATKSFSKWNTKADGSGTDYNAAATVATTAADGPFEITLYAIWA